MHRRDTSGEGIKVKHKAIKRRSVVLGIGATAGAAAVGGIAVGAQASSGTASSSSASSDSLVFNPDGYTEITTTLTDTDGTAHDVTYHFWKAVTYVSKPVDEKYQSLIVSVPVEIDGKAVDASNAPIVLSHVIAGYVESSVAEATGIGGAAGTGAPPTGGSPSTSASAAPPSGGGAAAMPQMALLAGYVVVE